MSHFCIFVLSPEKPEDPEAFVEQQLAPFNENLQADPYQKDCYCIGLQAGTDAATAANIVYNTEEIRNAFHEELGKLVNKKTNGKKYSEENRESWIKAREEAFEEITPSWEERMAPWGKLRKESLDNHPLKDKPDPQCSDCGGVGRHESTYNPNSKWDWWQVGGRWGGYLRPDYDPEKDPQNIETCYLCGGSGKRNDALGREHRERDPSYTCNGCAGKGKRAKWPTQWVTPEDGNISPISSILQHLDSGNNILPFAILRPTGEWLEKGEMGWWAIVSNEKQDWDATARKILEEYSNHWAIVVDCHI